MKAAPDKAAPTPADVLARNLIAKHITLGHVDHHTAQINAIALVSELTAILADRAARPSAVEEHAPTSEAEERIREDERDRLYEKADRHASRVSAYAIGAKEWLRKEERAMLPAERARLRKGDSV